MSDSLLIWGVRGAGVFHFVTLVGACFTPIPPNWAENLGFVLLQLECAIYASTYGWIVIRPV